MSPRTVASPATAAPSTCGSGPAGSTRRWAPSPSTPTASRTAADPGRTDGRRPGRLRGPRPGHPGDAGVEPVRAQRDRDAGPAHGAGHRVDIGRRVLPGWSVLPDGRSGNPGTHRTARAAQPVPRRPGRPPGRRLRRCPGGSPACRFPGCRPRTSACRERVNYAAADGAAAARSALPIRPAAPVPHRDSAARRPGSQERPAFSILIQSLVAAGFVVFAPNVRGSTGYGATLHRDGRSGRARESSFADVQADGEFLIDRGITAPGHVGVHGWSYGGYLAMISLTRFPELVRVRVQPRRHVRPAHLLPAHRTVDGGRVGHRVRRPGGRRPTVGRPVPVGSIRPDAGTHPVFCTASRTPTCRSSNRCRRAGRWSPRGVPTGPDAAARGGPHHRGAAGSDRLDRGDRRLAPSVGRG